MEIPRVFIKSTKSKEVKNEENNPPPPYSIPTSVMSHDIKFQSENHKALLLLDYTTLLHLIKM